MVSQSLATGRSLTNHHHQEQKRDEVKNQVFCRAPWFYFHKREVQGEARSPCWGTGSTWRAWLRASASASADITGSRGASYLYFTGDIAHEATVATAYIYRGHWMHKKGSWNFGNTRESKLLSSTMALLHQMTLQNTVASFCVDSLHITHHHHQPPCLNPKLQRTALSQAAGCQGQSRAWLQEKGRDGKAKPQQWGFCSPNSWHRLISTYLVTGTEENHTACLAACTNKGNCFWFLTLIYNGETKVLEIKPIRRNWIRPTCI